MTIDTIILFFGWCSIINMVIFSFAAIILMVAKDPITKIHSRLFSIQQEQLCGIYFQYLGSYKIAIIMLNIVPYFALKIIS